MLNLYLIRGLGEKVSGEVRDGGKAVITFVDEKTS